VKSCFVLSYFLHKTFAVDKTKYSYRAEKINDKVIYQRKLMLANPKLLASYLKLKEDGRFFFFFLN